MIEMATRRTGKILPPNSTALELDLLQAANRFPLLQEAVPAITHAKLIDMPDSYLPWLIEEYGLEPFVQFFGGDARRAIREGVPLIRKIGTPYAVKRLLALAGFTQAGLEEEPAGEAHWAEFQVALGQIPQSRSEIVTAEAAVALGKPLTRRLARIYHGLDVRPMMLDESLWEDSLLDDYSGIRLDPNGPVLSFGQSFEYRAGFPTGRPRIEYHNHQTLTVLAFYQDIFRLDEGILDMDGTLLNNEFSIGVSAAYIAQAIREAMPTPDVQTFCKAMVVADEQYLFGDLNMTFARSRIVEEGVLMMLDEGVFEEDGISSYEAPIDELIEQDHVAFIQTGPHGVVFTGHHGTSYAAVRTGDLPQGTFTRSESIDLGRVGYAAPGHNPWPASGWPSGPGLTWENFTLPRIEFRGSFTGARSTRDGRNRVTTDGRPREATIRNA